MAFNRAVEIILTPRYPSRDEEIVAELSSFVIEIEMYDTELGTLVATADLDELYWGVWDSADGLGTSINGYVGTFNNNITTNPVQIHIEPYGNVITDTSSVAVGSNEEHLFACKVLVDPGSGGDYYVHAELPFNVKRLNLGGNL